MRLVFTTQDYVYAGRPRSGFPVILGDDMTPAQPFHAYLHHELLGRGKALSLKTWEAYGRRLWDFTQFLHANQLTWDQPFSSHGQSVVRIYRDWQAEDLGLEAATINSRMRTVIHFYAWALGMGMIEALPFSYSDVTVLGIDRDLGQRTGRAKTVRRPDLLLDEWEKESAFLTAEQIKAARAAIRSTSQRLLFDLMVRVGLRSIEARTFPRKYVFDPAARSHMKPGTMIDVQLDPKDMDTKFSKSRTVHVPYSLMQDMYQYTLFERNRLLGGAAEPQPLIVTVGGTAFQKDSVRKVIHDVGLRVGFTIRPLMLRHSYAIHTLLLLRRCPDFIGEPLMYVRDRMGHRSVQTTMVYLKQIEQMAGGEALAMMAEFDRMFAVAPGLQAAAP
jgi:site-specific recombinase XerD